MSRYLQIVRFMASEAANVRVRDAEGVDVDQVLHRAFVLCTGAPHVFEEVKVLPTQREQAQRRRWAFTTPPPPPFHRTPSSGP